MYMSIKDIRKFKVCRFVLCFCIFFLCYALLFLSMKWTKVYSWPILFLLSLVTSLLHYSKMTKEEKRRRTELEETLKDDTSRMH